MDEGDWLAERFEDHRTRLRAVAYRMLGSRSEADRRTARHAPVESSAPRTTPFELFGIERLGDRRWPVGNRPAAGGSLRFGWWPAGSLVVRGRLGEELQEAGPAAALDGDHVVDRLAADEPVEEPVFQLDRGLPGSVGGEPHLDLAGVVGIGVVLPLAIDLPGDDQPVRWLPGQHPAPVALAAVDASFVPPSACTRFQEGVGH